MVDGSLRLLRAAGITDGKIHCENFTSYAGPEDYPA
jgi:hypothetical protein